MADGMDRAYALRNGNRCPRCTRDEQLCAFRTGVFDDDNFGCGTMNALRSLALTDGWLIPGVDAYLGVLPLPIGGFLVFSWVHNRKRVRTCEVVGGLPGPVTLPVLTSVIDQHG